MKGGGEVEGQDQVPLFRREFVDRGDVLHAGIVDEDVDRAGFGHHRLDRLGAGQIGVAISRAELLLEPGDLVRVAEAVEDHAGALRLQRPGDGQADAGGGAGDERCFAFEKHEPPFRLSRSFERRSRLNATRRALKGSAM